MGSEGSPPGRLSAPPGSQRPGRAVRPAQPGRAVRPVHVARPGNRPRVRADEPAGRLTAGRPGRGRPGGAGTGPLVAGSLPDTGRRVLTMRADIPHRAPS